MGEDTAGKVVGIYSIVYGSLRLILILNNFNVLTFLLSVLFLTFGIIIVVKLNNFDSVLEFVITLFVFYCLFGVVYLCFLIIPTDLIKSLLPPEYSRMHADEIFTGMLIDFLLVITPIVFSIIYFVIFAKNNPKSYIKKYRFQNKNTTSNESSDEN